MTDPRSRMKVLNGIPASPGIAIGRALLINRALPRSVHSTVSKEQAEDEVAAFLHAVARSREQIQAIREGVKDQSSDHYQILSVHLALLEDSMLVDQTVRLIRENQFKADWAFNKVLQNLLETFHRIEDKYLRERGHDLRQIGHRVLENLAGRPMESVASIREPVVVIAHDLSPADTAQILNSPVLGFATDVGSKTSHTAITARSLGIPAVVGLERVTAEFAENEDDRRRGGGRRDHPAHPREGPGIHGEEEGVRPPHPGPREVRQAPRRDEGRENA